MSQPGTQIFTYANFGKETTRGTPVAPTRQLYVEGNGVLDVDAGLNFHEGENSGVRTRIRRATQMKEDVNLKLRTASGVGYDDLVIPFSQLKGAQTGAGGGGRQDVGLRPVDDRAQQPGVLQRRRRRRHSELALSVRDVLAVQDQRRAQRRDLPRGRAVRSASREDGEGVAGDQQRREDPGRALDGQVRGVGGRPAGAAISTNHLLDWSLDVIPA
jgi:hypothetical protein